MKEYVFGDASGWLTPLEHALNDIDASLVDCFIPQDVTIVHVGDLIRKGPDSEILLQLVKEIKEKYDKQWVQLIGNHETNYLTTQDFGRWEITLEAERLLHELYEEGMFQISWSSMNNTHLATHSGLTQEFWKIIGSPTTASEAFQLLEKLDLDECNVPGQMLGEFQVPGCLWASSNREVYPSWEHSEKNLHDFIQIHGHTAPLNLYNMQRYSGYKEEWFVKANTQSRTIWSEVNGYKFVSTDPSCSDRRTYAYKGYKIPNNQ